MAPTQPFKPRAVKPAERKLQEQRARDRHAAPADGRSRSKPHHNHHHSDPSTSSPRSKSRTDHDSRKVKRDRRYDVVKKLDVCKKDDGMDAVSGSDEEYGSDLDLDKPLYSIAEYLNDRSQLVRKMFGCLKKDTLNKLVPPVLRDFSLKELEEKCVFELDGMSRKRVRALLSGQDLQSSSGTDDSEDEGPPPLRSTSNPRTNVIDHTITAQSPAESATSNTTEESVDSPASLQPATGQPDTTVGGRRCLDKVEPTEMDMVELELRAQALRAMMQQLDEGDKSSAADSGKLVETTDADSDALLDGALEREEGELSPAGGGGGEVPHHATKKRVEKDFFEIHVDEEEMADIE